MSRVFVFCIGGTGLRVMKSITMLLAAGMDANGYTIVPIPLDPHIDLEEKRKLNSLMKEYESVHDAVNDKKGMRLNPLKGFFQTPLVDLAEINGRQNDISEPISEKRSFGQYLNIGKLNSSDINMHLVHTLFSQSNLDNELSVGFKGSPNVGTVVLGEMIKGADWFTSFCNACQKDDRIFIISSIFGGTGASGYPLLEKKVRNSMDHPAVKDAVMGAVTVLPYYALEDPSTTDSDIDSANFLTKTKSALSYYERSVLSDYLYYIGEQDLKVTYENNESKQDDKAHFIELVAATALFDFLHQDKPDTTQHMSRSIKENVESLSISTLGDEYKDVVKAIADMLLLQRLINLLPEEKYFPLKKNRGLDQNFYNDNEFTTLKEFVGRFTSWYEELESNKRAFAPISKAGSSAKARLSNWIKDFSLDAKDESYYLLEMIRESNKDKDTSHDVKIRRFLDYAYKAINKYTSKLF